MENSLNNLSTNEIITLYNANLGKDDVTRELEIRINIANPSIFTDLFGHFADKKNPVFEQSITFITDRDTVDSKNNMIDTDRNIITFKKGKKQDVKYMKKKRLGASQFKARYLGVFSMILSEESEISQFSNNGAKTIIIRVRASFVKKMWQYDFNIIKELPVSYIQEIYSYKKTMLKDFDVDGFVKLIDMNGLKFSLEMEYRGGSDNIPDPITEDEVQKVINNIVCIIDPDHVKNVELQDAVHTISKYIRPRDESDFRSRFGFKKLVTQAKTITKTNYRDEIFPHLDEFYISPKADGERCIVLITNNHCQIITANNIINVNIGTEDEGVSVIDCELIYVDGQPKVIPIDVICLNNSRVSTHGFEIRYDSFEDARNLLGRVVAQKNHLND